MTGNTDADDTNVDETEMLERLFDRACALPVDTRAAFVKDACGENPALRDELLSLLQHADAAESFFERLGDAVGTAVVSGSVAAAQGDDAPSSVSFVAPLAEDSADPLIGHTVGRYEIRARIGRGGMGAVYRAHDARLRRDVALKFLGPDADQHSGVDDRLLAEARAAAALEHPNVCTIHEIGETGDGRPYIAMTLYTGETLKQRLQHGPLPASEAAAIAGQIARGLRAAHQHGIVHRDVKPANVILTPDGTVKLLDFGLARVADATVSRADAVTGTIAYMSPEQVKGETVDHRTDLWSLGVTFYEMLAGTRPFAGSNGGAILQSILSLEPARPAPEGATVPDPIWHVVERLLRKNPEERYASTDLLLDDLTRIAADAGALPRPDRVATRLGWLRLAALCGGGVVLIGIAIVAWLSSRPPSAAAPERSLAVLPFVNLSHQSDDEYFSDGMTEEIITQLAASPALKVISRTSAMRYKGSTLPLRRIATELGVANVLEGTVRREGNRVRITVQLIDARTDVHRWSRSFERERVGIFTVQEAIAREVGRALEVQLGNGGGEAAPRGTRDTEAYELALRARYHWQKRTREGHEKAVAYFQQAIERDSGYADAYAGLATVYLTGYAQYIPGFSEHEAETYRHIKWAAERAVALDDHSASAHDAVSILRWWGRDWPGAERELLRALELNPGDERAHNWYGALLGLTGRIEDAVRESHRAYELDPFNLTDNSNYMDQLVLARQYDRAIEQAHRTLEIDPNHPFTRRVLGILYTLTGRYTDAERELRRVADAAPNIPDFRADLAYAEAMAGHHDDARRILRSVEALPDGPRKRDASFSIGRAHVALGEADSAFAWFERADWRWPHRGNRYDPALDRVRNDPRFKRLQARVDREMGMR